MTRESHSAEFDRDPARARKVALVPETGKKLSKKLLVKGGRRKKRRLARGRNFHARGGDLFMRGKTLSNESLENGNRDSKKRVPEAGKAGACRPQKKAEALSLGSSTDR